MSDTPPQHGVPMEWYDQEPTHAHAYLVPTILSWLHKVGARRVLDLGCGNGAMTLKLAAEGFQLTGIDGSESGIRIASERAAGRAVFRHGWLDAPLPEDLRGKFDAVVAAEVIEHLPQPRMLCLRAAEALAPAGRLIVTTPYHGYLKNLALALTNSFDQHWHPLRDGGHIKFFSRASLTALLREQGFHVTDIAYGGRVPPIAKSIIVQAVAAKS